MGNRFGIVVLLLACATAVASAQQRRISPHEDITSVVHGSKVVITYGRPSMRGRAIFGALVPYGRVWCPGADEATTIDSGKPIRIGGVTIPPGPHTLWMLPAADQWTLILSDEASGFHTRYPAGKDLVRVPLTKRALDQPVEQLTFAIAQGVDRAGTITMTWERTAVSAAFTIE